jgi:hypothetical protein
MPSPGPDWSSTSAASLSSPQVPRPGAATTGPGRGLQRQGTTPRRDRRRRTGRTRLQSLRRALAAARTSRKEANRLTISSVE